MTEEMLETSEEGPVKFFDLAITNFDGALQEFERLTAGLKEASPLEGAGQSAEEGAGQAATRASVAMSPEVVVLEPSASEVTAEKVTVRGMAIDPTGIARVQVAGRTAAMLPRSPRATEFWVEDLPLKPGENELQIVATNVDKGEGKATVKVRRVAGGPAKPEIEPLGVEAVSKLLEAGVTPARMTTIVQERGVSFALTPAIESRLRALGATEGLLLEIAKAKR